ncbi:MAG: phage terminase large subunit, partial [Gammaproteobacteria bacterium]|nr:phage terminase large subunit [Gammaproteobacteria bacterium]
MAHLILDPLVLRDINPQDLDFPVFVEIYCRWQGWEASRPQLRMAEWLQETEAYRYRCLQAYRKASKSTVTSLYTPWRLGRDATWTVMLVSAGNDLIDRNSRFIRELIEEFPICQGWDMKPEDPELWKTSKFTIKRPPAIMNPSVQIRSIESKITGHRAKDLVIDDVEVMENVETEEQRTKLKQRVRALENLDAAQLFIGTPHDEDTVYRVLEESKKGFVFLKIPVRGEYANGIYVDNGALANPDVPIDGVAQDDAWVEEKKEALTEGEFQSQYLLIPAKAAKSLLRLDLINHYGDPDDERGGLTYDRVDEHLHRL